MLLRMRPIKVRPVRAGQPRHHAGRLGTDELARPYHVCPDGHGSCCPGDEAWALGAGTLNPDLLELGRPRRRGERL